MIVVTAPTGTIGSQVLRQLLDQGEELRVIVRNAASLPTSIRERVDVVVGSHADPAVVDRAFVAADAVFWLAPPDSRTPDLQTAYVEFTRPAAAAFVAHGVGHVVGVSALGRGTPVADRAGLVTASLAMDDVIADTGVAYRALANPSFMDNVLRQIDSIVADGVFFDTVEPDRKAPLAATRDIAAAAVELLTDRSWSGRGEVPVLGPAELSADDMAAVMTAVLDRPVRYQRQSLDDFAASLTAGGMSDAFVRGYRDMMWAKDNGLDAGVSRTPEYASPTSFHDWCVEVLTPAVTARSRSGAASVR
jgi:uncharacterized protein YbjT (DUF2867 family)